MSTNKTEHYALHSWEAADNFLRTEFNENFARLDGELFGLVRMGSYAGDGAESRTIELGFTPRAVFVISSSGTLNSDAYSYGGLALKGAASMWHGRVCVEVTEGGFTVYAGSGSYPPGSNRSNMAYRYLAIR